MMEWVREGERSIDAGSMRRLDQDAQQQAVSVAMNQFAPSVISLPGGAEIVGALAVEFGKLNRMPTLQAAAENMVKLARQQSAMQAAMAMAPPAGAPGAAPPAPGEPPTKPPNAGPEGGRPIV
jgi:hypothetical protein